MAFDRFPTLIDAQLNHLLTHSPFSIKVDQMWSGSKIPGSLDRVTLLIPFCLGHIKWDLIYNASRPAAAPDIIFASEDEPFRPFRMAREEVANFKATKNSLLDWNGKDASRLLSLIHELREEYKAYQRKRVEEVDDDRVIFEISTIPSREGIEMLLNNCSADKPAEVKFAVPLVCELDINRRIAGCTWKHQQNISLQVIFLVGRKRQSICSSPRLDLVGSPELNDLIPLEEVNLPPWLDGMCMAEYLPILEHNLQEQILYAVSLIGQRREFIEALGSVFGRPLEVDPIFCRKATFHVTSGLFTFLVHFVIPSQFPKLQAIMILQSSQHFNIQGVPIKSAPLTSYLWSPRWEFLRMAEKIFEFLGDECLKFKKYCNDMNWQA